MIKPMKISNLIVLFCLLQLDFLHGYQCPSMLLVKNCTAKTLHCLPLYPDWNKYELLCSEAKSFVPGTCPVYFKVDMIITSVPCPPFYYTSNVYRSNDIEVPKLKLNCTEEGQLTHFTNSTVNNLCYCVEDYSFQRNETYCDPTVDNCTCHRNTTDVMNIDASFDLWTILNPVVAVTSMIVVLFGITGLWRKCRNQQLKSSEPKEDEEQDMLDEKNESNVIDVAEDDIIDNARPSHTSIQETQDEQQTSDYVDIRTAERLPFCSPNHSTDNIDNAYSTEMDFLESNLKPSKTIILSKIAESGDV
ncbi:Hypothetical predicted protein [Mytilus galloprovincialis]|uniref:Uncharacterized protein n=2 Tax=Mytilus galloprovincialis TaxID=29158 RepID=A0A8B6FNC1_MYTGA|nr:Hypothetical predicted protein [Mytilus galloprovincialis]